MAGRVRSMSGAAAALVAATALMGAGPSFTSPVGPTTFGVPAKGTPEYADYLQMLRSSAFLKDKEGAVPYDPEWRAVVVGRRNVPETDAQLTGGMPTLAALARRILTAIAAKDAATLRALQVSAPEFERICWAPLPQARPYAAVPWREAWGFQQAQSATSVKHMLEEFGGRELVVDSLQAGTAFDYGLYVLHRDVAICARDTATDQVLMLWFAPAIAERRGQFKVLTYDFD